jgi:YHS domain-containing protein
MPAHDRAATEQADSSDAEKLRRIEERSGQSGLKGFCPVALRDDRELLDSQIEYQATFEGKTWFFSSARAKAKFLENPRKFVPVAGGADVVVLAHSRQDVPGTLDHALWFRERLYLFSSAESCQTFLRNPKQYAEAANEPAAP